MSEKNGIRKLLDECIHQDEATLIGEYEKLTKQTIVNFRCKCGVNHSKKILQLCEVSGAFCKECTMKNRQLKSKATNLNKYGVENPSQLTHIKLKKKETTQKNYGVDNPSQSHNIKEKKNETTMKHFGVSNPFQSNNIKEK